jgi:ApeA-like protein
LVLNGTEEQLAKLPTGETKPTFFGRLMADYTYDATLFDVVLRKGPSQTHPRDPSKETSAEFVTNTVLISEHVASQDMALFNGAIVKLTGLDEWCDVTGFSGRHENATPNELASGSLTVAFRERATPRYDLGNRTTLRFLSEYAGPRRFENLKQVSLKERNTLELIFPGAISINQTVQELHIWQSFLTFGLRQASYTDEVFLLRLSSRGYDRFGLLLPGRKVPEPRRRRRRDTLFCQSTFGDRIEERLRGCHSRGADPHGRSGRLTVGRGRIPRPGRAIEVLPIEAWSSNELLSVVAPPDTSQKLHNSRKTSGRLAQTSGGLLCIAKIAGRSEPADRRPSPADACSARARQGCKTSLHKRQCKVNREKSDQKNFVAGP